MNKTNSSWLKTFSIGFSIISFGITIAIVGYIVLATRQNQSINQPSPTPTSTADETANWKTYTNDEAGFSVKYPDFLDRGVGSSDIPRVDIWAEKHDSYTIYIYTYPDSASFEKGTHLGFNAEIKDEEEIMVGGQATKKLTGIEIVSERGTLIHVGPIKYLGRIYLFVYTSGNNIAKEESLSIFGQILSTFKFTD